MSILSEQAAFLLDACKLIEYATEQGFNITAGEMYRTEYQQAKYVAEGKSKTMNSYHLKRLAIDLNFFLNGVVETSKNGIKTLDKIIKLQGDCREKISGLGRRSKLGENLLKILYTSPIVNVNKIVKELDVTFPTANVLISDFEKIGIFKEVTGYDRNRLFSFVSYIDLFKSS